MKAIDFNQNIKQLTEDFVGRTWVFKEIDQWLQQKTDRFFILLGEPGVGKSAIAAHLIQSRQNIVAYHFCQTGQQNTLQPGLILRSIAAQLMKSLPRYGLALLNTIKPTLGANVTISVNEVLNSEIVEVSIENLKSRDSEKSDLENELDILIRAPLAELPKLYPDLYATQAGATPTLKVFLIDGLDVAVSSEDAAQEDEDIVTLLASLFDDESLPSWMRFILTSRPDRRVLREFEPLEPYKLDEMSEQNQADIRNYVENQVTKPALQSQLEAAQISSQTLIDELTEKSKGNFRYVRCLLDDFKVETQSLNHLPELPESLKQVYANEWIVAASSEECKTILTAIADAKEFLTEDELVSLTKLPPRLVRQALWGLRQFLDVGTKHISGNPETDERDVEAVDTFAIFHPSLREYLRTSNLK